MSRSKGKEKEEEYDIEAQIGTPPRSPVIPQGSESPSDDLSLPSDAPVTTSCFGIPSRERIPRSRRWNSLCFSMDREAVTFFTSVFFAFITGFYCFGMMAYLIITDGSEVHIALYFGLLSLVVGFFLGNTSKLRKSNSGSARG